MVTDMKDYKTILSPAEDEFEVKKSIFIGHVAPVTTADEALAFVAEMKKKYKDATHNCWAYLLKDENTKRYSDDGEPQGTAGIPILDSLEKSGVRDICMVVTRYFGGTLLGAGGLVRAYSHGASIALQAAQVITMCVCTPITLTLQYNQYGLFENIHPRYELRIENTEFLEDIKISLIIKQKDKESFLNEVREAFYGKVVPQVGDDVFSYL